MTLTQANKKAFSKAYKRVLQYLDGIGLDLDGDQRQTIAKITRKHFLTKTAEEIALILLEAYEEIFEVINKKGGEIVDNFKPIFYNPPKNKQLTAEINGLLLNFALYGKPLDFKQYTEKHLRKSRRTAEAELHRATTYARYLDGLQAEKNGKTVLKKWVATIDDRTRETHALADGVTLPISEPFTLADGSRLQFPQDDSLGADISQLINCRCKLEIIIKD